MKILSFFLLAFTAELFQVGSKELNVSLNDSVIVWTGTKVWGKHQGVVRISEGKVSMKDRQLDGGYFVIDMNSIECTDIPDDEPVPKKRLENHLKDPDFFDVSRHPTAKFVITRVRPSPNDENTLIATGDLTIKNSTRPIDVEIKTEKQTNDLFIGRADIRFNRQHWGVAFKGIGDEMVHDQVTLNVFIKAEGNREQAAGSR